MNFEVPDYLQKMHQRAYEMLEVFDEFCAAHNLTYFLIGGSLLGAVRHQGFIPWDDDIDVGMPRDDYEKFVSLWEDDEDMALIEYRKNKDYSNYYAKLSDTHSKVNTWYYKESFDYQQGVFIDVFPMDMAAADYSESLAIKGKVDRLASIVHNNQWAKLATPTSKPFGERAKLFGFKFAAYVLNHLKPRASYISDMQTLLTSQTSDLMVNYATNYELKREIWPKAYADNIERVSFETGQYPVFKSAHDALVTQYGPNYMELPKNVDTTAHHGFDYVEIDGKVYIKNGEIV